MKTKESLLKGELMLECAFCEFEAVSGVDAVAGNEYYAVCLEDLQRLVTEYSMVQVELIVDTEPCGCGCE